MSKVIRQSSEHRSVGLQSTCFPVFLPIAAQCYGRRMRMSHRFQESSALWSWLVPSVWLQCEELLCFHTPAGWSRAEADTLSCQQLLQPFRKNIQEFPSSPEGEIRDCLEHVHTGNGPVPGRSPGHIPSFLRKPKSPQRVTARSPTVWWPHIWLLGL